MSRKEQLTAIVAGLAASGHYTKMCTVFDGKKDIEEPRILSWKQDGLPGQKSRLHYHIIDDAVAILEELEKEY